MSHSIAATGRVSLIHELFDHPAGYVDRLRAAVDALAPVGKRRGRAVSYEMALLVVMVRLADADASRHGHCWTFQTTIARQLRIGRQAVVAADKAAEAAGLMVPIGKRGKASNYQMLPDVFADHVRDASYTSGRHVSDDVSDDVYDDVYDGMSDASYTHRTGTGTKTGKVAREAVERAEAAAIAAALPPFPAMPPCPKHPDGWRHDDDCRVCGINRRGTEARDDAMARYRPVTQPAPEPEPADDLDPAAVAAFAAAARAAMRAARLDDDDAGALADDDLDLAEPVDAYDDAIQTLELATRARPHYPINGAAVGRAFAGFGRLPS